MSSQPSSSSAQAPRSAKQQDAPSGVRRNTNQPSADRPIAQARRRATQLSGYVAAAGGEDVLPYGQFIYVDGQSEDTVPMFKKKEKDSEERLAYEEAADDLKDLLIGVKLLKLAVLNSLPSDHPLITRIRKLAHLFEDFLPTNTEYLGNQELVNRVLFYLNSRLEHTSKQELVLNLFEEVSKEISELPDVPFPSKKKSRRSERAQETEQEERSGDEPMEHPSENEPMEHEAGRSRRSIRAEDRNLPKTQTPSTKRLTAYIMFMQENNMSSPTASPIWKAMSQEEKNGWRAKLVEKRRMDTCKQHDE